VKLSDKVYKSTASIWGKKDEIERQGAYTVMLLSAEMSRINRIKL
jgi:hypothetical protein